MKSHTHTHAHSTIVIHTLNFAQVKSMKTIVESGWNVWVWLVGVVVRRYIDLLILLPYSSVLFLQQYPYFLFLFLIVFRSCSGTFLYKNFRY